MNKNETQKNIKTLAEIVDNRAEGDTVKSTIIKMCAAFGYDVVRETIAATIKAHSDDGRIKRSNKEKAATVETFNPCGEWFAYADSIHPAHLDNIADILFYQSRKEFEPVKEFERVNLEPAQETEDDKANTEALRKLNAEPATLGDILAEVSPKALKQLSDAPAFRFDYNKSVKVYRIRGAFTAAKVEKIAGEWAQDAAVIIQTYEDKQRGRECGRVCAFEDGTFEFVRAPYVAASLGYFYTKGEINEARKISRNAFIITQASDDRRGGDYNRETVGGLFLDASNRLARGERARGVKFDYCHTQSGARRYMRVNGWLDNGGAAFSFKFGNWGEKYPETDPAPFDASGYYVAIKRDNLKRRAQQLRIERARAAAQAHDFGAEIAEARAELDNARRAVLASLAAANNWREFSRIDNAARQLTYAAQFLDILTEKAAAGTLASIERGRAYVASVKEYADKARAALAEVKE